MRADRAAPRHFPAAGRELERLGQQRAHRTDIDHVARELGLDRLAHKGGDFRMLATVDHADFHDAAHFLAKTYATRAMYAALHAFGGNQRSHFLGHDHAFFFLVARRRGRSEEQTSELQSLMRNSYDVFCLKKKKVKLS